MITALTSARIRTANKLYDMQNELRELRSFICFNEKEVMGIDNMIGMIDKLVNRIMK